MFELLNGSLDQRRSDADHLDMRVEPDEDRRDSDKAVHRREKL